MLSQSNTCLVVNLRSLASKHLGQLHSQDCCRASVMAPVPPAAASSAVKLRRCQKLRLVVLVTVLSALSVEAAPPKFQGWKTIKLNLAKGARDGYLFVPPTYTASKASPLIVVLHGARKGARDALEAFSQQDVPLLAAQRCLLLVPESREGTWDVIIRRSFGPDLRYIKTALEGVLQRYRVDPRRTGLLGFSDGATYALSTGLGGNVFSHVIAYSPGGFIPPPGGAGRTKVYISHGLQDTIFPIQLTSRQIVPQVRQAAPGNELHYVEFRGGHEVPPAISKQALEWFLTGAAVRGARYSTEAARGR